MDEHPFRSSHAISADGTTIAYETVGLGPDLIVVGGVLRVAEAYRDLAIALADHFTVHLMQRRGRGRSGPQGDGYGARTECEDVCAVQEATGAQLAFGHSYGGFAVLQAAQRSSVFEQVAVYEPGVMLDEAPAPAWLAPYRDHLIAGDRRSAFATMVKHAGFAPGPLAAMPLRAVRLILRIGVRGAEWQQTEALLETNLAEQQALFDARGTAGYADVAARTLLIGGSASPPSVAAQIEALRLTIPDTTVTTLDGLDHLAPETKPARVAHCVTEFFAEAALQPTRA